MQENSKNVLTIEQQNRLTMTGVSSVDAFSDSAITLTVSGKKVQISGAHLKVLAFSEGTGNFAASGEVYSVKYGGKSAFKKIFK